MQPELILEVVADGGRLFVRPAKTRFEQIHRAAMGVTWDASRGALASPARIEWTLVRWFEQVLAAAASEYGIALHTGPTTSWTGVTADEEKQMADFAASDWLAKRMEAQAALSAEQLSELRLRQALSLAAGCWSDGRWADYVCCLAPVRDLLSPAQRTRLLIAERRAMTSPANDC
ncbi:MAG TPA: hypothetical protein VG939_18125 [Caulobacteraceae bacterium]|nr:hypothetical protein [Caulobacteraceae bacterium]